MNKWTETIQRGQKVEAFVKQELLPSVGISCILNNQVKKTDIDLRIGAVLIEIKTAFTPYPCEITPSGLNTSEHLTLDYANIEKYDDDVKILFLVRYNNPRVCWIRAGKVKEIIRNNPKRIYSRSGRTFKDKRKKIGIAFSECEDLTHLFPPNILEKINSL